MARAPLVRGSEWPPIPDRLMEYLKETFPPRVPQLREDPVEYAEYAARVRFIQVMESVHYRQTHLPLNERDFLEEGL